jgi:hypothetical protein
MSQNDFKVVPLSSLYPIKPFDCGEVDLNEFLHEDSLLFQQQRLAMTYLIENENRYHRFFLV